MNTENYNEIIERLEERITQLELELPNEDRSIQHLIQFEYNEDFDYETGEDRSFIKYRWGHASWCEMHHHHTYMTLHSNGDYKTTCHLENKSNHRKYGNYCLFYLCWTHNEESIGLISGWSGNFGTNETKDYPTSGNSTLVQAQFDNLRRGKVQPWRLWHKWKR